MQEPAFTYGKTKKPKPAPKPFDYGAVSGDDKRALRSYVTYAQSVARKSTLEIFELGKRLRDARERLPGRYEDWVKRELTGITVRTAQNYTSVFETFDHRREEIVALGLKPTSLYALADAPPPAVEEVLERAGQGERLTGAAIGQIIKLHRDPEEAQSPAPTPGGPKGLRLFVGACVADRQRRLLEVAAEILAYLEEHLPPSSKRVTVSKDPVHKALALRCSSLGTELATMTGYNSSNPFDVALGIDDRGHRGWPDKRWQAICKGSHVVGRVGHQALPATISVIEESFLPGLRWALGRDDAYPAFDMPHASTTPSDVDTSEIGSEEENTSISL